MSTSSTNINTQNRVATPPPLSSPDQNKGAAIQDRPFSSLDRAAPSAPQRMKGVKKNRLGLSPFKFNFGQKKPVDPQPRQPAAQPNARLADAGRFGQSGALASVTILDTPYAPRHDAADRTATEAAANPRDANREEPQGRTANPRRSKPASVFKRASDFWERNRPNITRPASHFVRIDGQKILLPPKVNGLSRTEIQQNQVFIAQNMSQQGIDHARTLSLPILLMAASPETMEAFRIVLSEGNAKVHLKFEAMGGYTPTVIDGRTQVDGEYRQEIPVDRSSLEAVPLASQMADGIVQQLINIRSLPDAAQQLPDSAKDLAVVSIQDAHRAIFPDV
ncbi:MAG: hypothetical protein AAFQ09_10340 [Pseudomonadota bacterium]